MQRIFLPLIGLAVLAAGAFFVVTQPERVAPDDLAGLTGDVARGETVFWAAGCASCHAVEDATGDDRLVLAGGRRLVSDFGTFVSPNVSMDPVHGIGDWTQEEFVTAIAHGTSPEGRHYYPSLPYPSYALAETQDLVDLWAFWQTLPASDVPSEPHELGFPFTIRRGVGLWNQLHMQEDFVLAGDLSPEVERGRYLTEALAHCAECHTPRTAFGGLDRARWMEGAPNPSGTGTIPALTPDRLDWSAEEIAIYLKDGFAPDFDIAGGSMADVVKSLANLTDEDRMAIALYFKALPNPSRD